MLNVKALAILLMTLAALFVVACGDDDDDGGTDTSSGDGATDAAATDEPAATEATVTIENTAFSPTEFAVAAAEPVVITVQNNDGGDHTFTVYTDEEFSEPLGTEVELPGGEEDAVEGSFDAATYFFRCEIHPSQMQGSFTAE